MGSSFTERFTEGHQFSDDYYPANRAIGVYNTAWHNMSVFERAIVEIRVGVMAQGATFDCLLQEAQDNAGTGAAAIAGKAITQLTQAGGDGNDTCIIELRGEEMTPGYDHMRAVATVAGNTVLCDVHIIRLIPKYAAVTTAPLTEVID